MAVPVFKTELRGVTLRGWFDSIPSPPSLPALICSFRKNVVRAESHQRSRAGRAKTSHHEYGLGWGAQRPENAPLFSLRIGWDDEWR